MNFQSSPIYKPVRVLVVNPLSSPAKLIIVKIMSGFVFGMEQFIDLTLLVYDNEITKAEDFKLELHSCAFRCMNTVKITSDLPNISDADVFCIISNFKNPNKVKFYETDENQFDALYLTIKIAHALSKPPITVVREPADKPKIRKKYQEELYHRPIIMTDGLDTMNIIRHLTRDCDHIPNDVFFCPTQLTTIAKMVLGDHFKLPTNAINDVLAWAANDKVFHVKIHKPIVKYDNVGVESGCDWDMIGRAMMDKLNLDHTQFNASWMKKEFIEKIAAIASKNPQGSIYRASVFANTLKIIWNARCADEGIKTFASVGVISDGSLETVKGYAYVLPLIFLGDTWSVNKDFCETSHLQQEINRMNKVVIKHKDKLLPYCKRFFVHNIINKEFIPSSNDLSSGSTSTVSTSSSSSVVDRGGAVKIQLCKHKI